MRIRPQQPLRRLQPHRLAVAAVLFAATLACDGADDVPTASAPGDFAAPPSPHATLVLEPAALEIGEVTVAELAVVTPPGFRVLPIAPVELPGLWLLGVRSLPLETEPLRWIQRTEFRVRPRDIGTHTWPGMEVRIEGPEGATEILNLAPRTFEVTSVRARFASRQEPFGLERENEEGGPDGSFKLGLATGVGMAALITVLGFGLRRTLDRRRAEASTNAVAASHRPAISLGEWSERELNDVLESVESDPQQAARCGAHLLRVYMSRRYGCEAEAATTEELETRSPSLAERALWPDFTRILHNLDDVRFRPNGPSSGAEVRARTRRALEDALRLVAASRPDTPQRGSA
jgi:hypothetical protein